jgi:two-component system response regulator YesN
MYNLLVVDDESIIVEGIAEMLADTNLPLKQIDVAYSAEEGLAKYEEFNHNIVITDIRMPEIDGIEFIKRIRQINTDTKIIILTGHRDFQYARDAVKYQANEYLLKPIKDVEIVKTVQNAIMSIDLQMKKSAEVEALKVKLSNVSHDSTVKTLKLYLDEYSRNAEELERIVKTLPVQFDFSQNVSLAIIKVDSYGKHFLIKI